MASQNFKLFYVEIMSESSRADYLQLFMTWSIVQMVMTLEVNPSRFGFQRGKIMLLRFQPWPEPLIRRWNVNESGPKKD